MVYSNFAKKFNYYERGDFGEGEERIFLNEIIFVKVFNLGLMDYKKFVGIDADNSGESGIDEE